jgi:putative transposase
MKSPRSTHPYVPTDEGWLYIAGHKDLFNRGTVGYAMGERLTKSLVEESLIRGIIGKKTAKGFDSSLRPR